MTYDSMEPHMDGNVVLDYIMHTACSRCGKPLGYGPRLKEVKFCPFCGYRLQQVPFSLSPKEVLVAVRDLMVRKREEGGDGG